MRATPPDRPWQANAAFGCYLAAAGAAVALGLLIAAAIPAALRQETGSVTVQPGTVTSLITVVGLITVLYAAGVVVLAVLFRSGRGWARIPLVVVSALSVFVIAGYGAVVLMLVVAADVLVFWPPVGRWLRGERLP